MKMEKMLMYAIPIGIGGALLYAIATKPQAPATSAKVVPGAEQAQMGYGIPSFTGTPSVGMTSSSMTLLSIASQQLGIPPFDLVVRGLRPEDLGLTTSWNFTSGAVNTWENWVNHTIADNTFIAIQGVSYGGTNFAQVRIQAGAKYTEFWNLSFVSGLINQLYWDESPTIVEQNQPIVIDVISKAAQATESINLMGTVVEKRGMVVNP
jgi:hypothetical protein